MGYRTMRVRWVGAYGRWLLRREAWCGVVSEWHSTSRVKGSGVQWAGRVQARLAKHLLHQSSDCQRPEVQAAASLLEVSHLAACCKAQAPGAAV